LRVDDPAAKCGRRVEGWLLPNQPKRIRAAQGGNRLRSLTLVFAHKEPGQEIGPQIPAINFTDK
jgi:hypothetical protein